MHERRLITGYDTYTPFSFSYSTAQANRFSNACNSIPMNMWDFKPFVAIIN